MAAWEENSLYWSWDYSNTSDFSVNQFYGQRDFEGLEYNGGLLSTSGVNLNLSSDQPMIGLVSFSFRYRAHHWNFRATPRAEISKRNGETDRSERLRLSTSWDDGDLLDGDLHFNAGAEGGTGDSR